MNLYTRFVSLAFCDKFVFDVSLSTSNLPWISRDLFVCSRLKKQFLWFIFRSKTDNLILSSSRMKVVLFYLFGIIAVSRGIELTFELPDNANQCFYEDLKAGIDSVFEFQVSFLGFDI